MLCHLKLLAADKIHESIKTSIVYYPSLDEEVKNALHESLLSIFELLSGISDAKLPEESDYYKKAQDKLGHLILQMQSYNDKELDKFFVENLSQFIFLTHTLHVNLDNQSFIKQAFLTCFFKAQNLELWSNYQAQTEFKQQELQRENQDLKKENENLKRKIELLEKNSSLVTPDACSETFIHFKKPKKEVFGGSGSFNFFDPKTSGKTENSILEETDRQQLSLSHF